MKTLSGTDTSKLSEKERMDIAVLEATESMRNIAQKHGLSPQDISSHFGGGGTRPATNPTDASKSAAPTKPAAPEGATSTAPKSEPEKPKSAIEKELEVKTKGPTLPGTDDKDGLFK
jgi:transposase-like protein